MTEFLLDHLWHWIALPLLLVGSAFFSGSETAYFSLERHLLRAWAQSHRRLERVAAHLVADRQGLLITILLGNLVVNVLFYSVTAMLSWTLVHDYNSRLGATLVGLIGLVGIVVVGEVLPKSVAYRWPMRFARAASLPMQAIDRLLRPPGKVFRRISMAIASPVHRRPSRHHLTTDELDDMLELSSHEGHIDRTERRTLERVLTSCRLKVRDVMTARVDLVAFDLTQPVDEFYELAHTSHHTRIPAYRGSMQEMAGILRVREVLLKRPTTRRDLERLLHPVVYVPETKTVDSLLMDFRKGRYNAVLAVDEFGGIEGLVTAEDVVEEIVGPIVDEFDPAERHEVERVGRDEYEVDGELPVTTFEDRFETELEKTPAATIGGFVVHLLDDMPRVGDEAAFGNLVFRVSEMRKRRITRLRVSYAPEGEGGGVESEAPSVGRPGYDTEGEESP